MLSGLVETLAHALDETIGLHGRLYDGVVGGPGLLGRGVVESAAAECRRPVVVVEGDILDFLCHACC